METDARFTWARSLFRLKDLREGESENLSSTIIEGEARYVGKPRRVVRHASSPARDLEA